MTVRLIEFKKCSQENKNWSLTVTEPPRDVGLKESREEMEERK